MITLSRGLVAALSEQKPGVVLRWRLHEGSDGGARVEFFVRIIEEDGKRLADLIPADDQEGRKWLRGKVRGFSYWAISSDTPKFMVHVYYQGDSPPENVRLDWNEVIEVQVLDYMDHN